MADMFEVGETAILWRQISPHHGKHVVIKAPLRMHWWHDCVTGEDGEGMAYYIDIPGDAAHDRVAEPHELRKLPPPANREEVGEWDLCPWKPFRVTMCTMGTWSITTVWRLADQGLEESHDQVQEK